MLLTLQIGKEVDAQMQCTEEDMDRKKSGSKKLCDNNNLVGLPAKLLSRYPWISVNLTNTIVPIRHNTVSQIALQEAVRQVEEEDHCRQ